MDLKKFNNDLIKGVIITVLGGVALVCVFKLPDLFSWLQRQNAITSAIDKLNKLLSLNVPVWLMFLAFIGVLVLVVLCYVIKKRREADSLENYTVDVINDMLWEWNENPCFGTKYISPYRICSQCRRKTEKLIYDRYEAIWVCDECEFFGEIFDPTGAGDLRAKALKEIIFRIDHKEHRGAKKRIAALKKKDTARVRKFKRDHKDKIKNVIKQK